MKLGSNVIHKSKYAWSSNIKQWLIGEYRDSRGSAVEAV